MAELEISKRVAASAEGEALPKPYHRTVSPEVTHFPDLQGAVSQYASASNWMSAIGSEVASRASTAIASRIGTEMGKNPQGDIGIPFTEFDKVMHETYRTQTQATLGLQAHKLITDTNLELARSPRITPEMIAKSQSSITLGLQNIFKNAPTEVRSNLEYQFGNQVINQGAQLTERMIGEQRQDQKNNIELSNKVNSEQAYAMALSGDDKAAKKIVENTRDINNAGVNSRVTTPESAKVATDTARLSYEKGKITREYEAARKAGKGEEYLKNLADKKPSYLSDADYLPVTNHLISYVGQQQSLRSQDENLRIAQFNTLVGQNVNAITGAQIQELKENISPLAFEKAQLHYINTMKAKSNENNELNGALLSWNDPSSFARATEKGINKGFDTLVTRQIQQGQQDGTNITRDQAEVNIAASAGGKVPVFVNTLKNKINSANPVLMDSAAVQVEDLLKRNAGHALIGLTDQDKSILGQYKSLRDSLPADEAARTAITNANQDYDTQQANKSAWSEKLKVSTGNHAITPSQYGLDVVGLRAKEFFNVGIANEYGNIIIHKYGTYYQMTNRDDKTARKLVQQDVEQNFGDTQVNGGKYKTLHPLEKVLGYSGNSDIVPFIQQDVISQLQPRFDVIKKQWHDDKRNDYWEVVEAERTKRGYFSTSYNPIQVKHHSFGKKGKETQTYDVVLIGNSFNWDIALNTESGTRPFMQIAPYMGIATYTPNKDAIDAAYMKAHGVR